MSNVKQDSTLPDAFFDGVTPSLPALRYAQALQQRCHDVGFDWQTSQPVLDKVKEEVEEVQEELNLSPLNKARMAEEIGDAFFALVNLARHMDIDADQALRDASNKFKRRFEHVVSLASAEGKPVSHYELRELEQFWVQAKEAELPTKKFR